MSSPLGNGWVQKAQLDSNGDRQFTNADYAALSDFCLGKCNRYAASPPTISDVSKELTLNGTNEAVLSMQVSGVGDINAWVVITQPDFQHVDDNEPVSELSKNPLLCDQNQLCSAVYKAFDLIGDYQVTYYAQNSQYQMATPITSKVIQTQGKPVFTNSPAVYDPTTGILSINVVQAGLEYYRVYLQNEFSQGQLVFSLASAVHIENPVGKVTAKYDFDNRVLTIPIVQGFGGMPSLSLKHGKDFLFRLNSGLSENSKLLKTL